MKKMTLWLTVFAILLIPSLGTADMYPSQHSEPTTTYYGRVNAIYPVESFMIIDDISITFNDSTTFMNVYGSTVNNVTDAVTINDYVKYHVQPMQQDLVLIDMEIISEQQYNQAIALEDTY